MTPTVRAFSEMAEKIQKNGEGDSTFGGAFVIFPPQRGEPISVLVIDENSDPLSFWQLVQAKASVALDKLQQDSAQREAWSRP